MKRETGRVGLLFIPHPSSLPEGILAMNLDPKEPFDIQLAMRRIREAVRPYPPAALFELADDGFGSLFELLIACIISIRTRDEVTLPTARKLFDRARTPQAVSQLTPA